MSGAEPGPVLVSRQYPIQLVTGGLPLEVMLLPDAVAIPRAATASHPLKKRLTCERVSTAGSDHWLVPG
jgi:hypothetical protein